MRRILIKGKIGEERVVVHGKTGSEKVANAYFGGTLGRILLRAKHLMNVNWFASLLLISTNGTVGHHFGVFSLTRQGK